MLSASAASISAVWSLNALTRSPTPLCPVPFEVLFFPGKAVVSSQQHMAGGVSLGQPAVHIWGNSGEEGSWEQSYELVLGAVLSLQAADLGMFGSDFAQALNKQH